MDEFSGDSVELKKLSELLFGWLRSHFDEIMSFDPAPQFHFRQGVAVGRPFTSTEFSREFIAYLETPQSIRRARIELDKVAREDVKVYTYIYLRGLGYSVSDINKISTGILPKLVRPKGRKPTTKSTKLHLAALGVLLTIADGSHSVERQLVEKLKERAVLRRERIKSNRNKGRVPCPKCNGNDRDCIVCNDPHGKFEWTGLVPQKVAAAYRRVIEAGGDWTATPPQQGSDHAH